MEHLCLPRSIPISTPGLDVVLLGVRVFYRSRFSPLELRPFPSRSFPLFSVSRFFFFSFFGRQHSFAIFRSTDLDRFFFFVSRNRVSFFSQTFLLTFSFSFFFLVLTTSLCPRAEYFEHAEKAGFDKGYDWLILSFDVRVHPETTIKIQGGYRIIGNFL